MDDTLKRIQEAYDKCNFSEEEKKLFPRPEREEDLNRFNNLTFTPTTGFGFESGLLAFLLGLLLSPTLFGGYVTGSDLLKAILKNEKIDKTEKGDQ